LPEEEITAAAGLRPTLYLGIGGLACSVLRRLKQRLLRRFGNLATVPALRLLLVDTDRSELRDARAGSSSLALTAEETLLAPLHPPEHYRPRSRGLLRWLDRRWLYGIPRSLLTEGLRPLGRLALVDNAADILSRLRDTLTAINTPEARASTAMTAGVNVSEDPPQVFVVASVAGGTSSGMVISMAYAVRQILADLNLPSQSVHGLLLFATSQKPADSEMARVNAHATLTELHHHGLPDSVYTGDPDHGLSGFNPGQPPFGQCYLMHLGEQLSKPEVDAATDALAEYLYFEGATTDGARLQQLRSQFQLGSPQRSRPARSGDPGEPGSPQGTAPAPVLHTLGLYRIGFPRHRVAEVATLLLCQRLVERWPGELPRGARERIEEEARLLTEQSGLTEDVLASRFQTIGAEALGEDPETCFQTLVGNFLASAGDLAQHPDPAGVTTRLLDRIDAFLGVTSELGTRNSELGTEEGRSGFRSEFRAPSSELGKTTFATRLQAEGRRWGTDLGRSAMAWLVSIVEDPERRLRLADMAAQWMGQYLRKALEASRTRLTAAHAFGEELRHRLADPNGTDAPSPVRWLPFGRKPAQSRSPTSRAFVEYCWLRFEEAVLDCVLTVLGAVHHAVSRFAQDLMLCRQKVKQLVEMFGLGSIEISPGAPLTPQSNATELLPGRCTTVAEAATALVRSLPSERLRMLDEDVQLQILGPHGGLWGLVAPTGDATLHVASLMESDLVGVLKVELQARARSIVLGVLRELDAARLFLENSPEPEEMQRILASWLKTAQPRVSVPGSRSHLILALPNSAAGQRFRSLVTQQLPNVSLSVLTSEGDVLVGYQEVNLPVPLVAEALIANTPGCAATARQVLTRTDVTWTPLGEQ
jgi:hypothetical protein